MAYTGLEGAGVAPSPAAQEPPAPGSRRELAVVAVEDERGLDALEQEWGELLERSDATVFQTFEWQRTWWRHFGERRRDAALHVVTVRGPDGLAAIAPLYVERSRVLGAHGHQSANQIGGCLEVDHLELAAVALVHRLALGRGAFDQHLELAPDVGGVHFASDLVLD